MILERLFQVGTLLASSVDKRVAHASRRHTSLSDFHSSVAVAPSHNVQHVLREGLPWARRQNGTRPSAAQDFLRVQRFLGGLGFRALCRYNGSLVLLFQLTGSVLL